MLSRQLIDGEHLFSIYNERIPYNIGMSL